MRDCSELQMETAVAVKVEMEVHHNDEGGNSEWQKLQHP
jgi:hypothetical protein